jgi:hypothetical protein
MLRTPALKAFLPALAAASLLASHASADVPAPQDRTVDPVKAECVRAAEDGQADKIAGKLISARSELIACARDVCPAAVRTSCARWFSDVNASVPSVVLRAAGPCSASEIDAANTKLIVADVSLGIGVIATGVAAWLFLKPQPADERSSPARSGLGVSSSSHGVAVNWAGTF